SVAKETATPASTQATGTNQRLERMWSPSRNRVNGRDCTGERTQGCVFSRAAPLKPPSAMFRAKPPWKAGENMEPPGVPQQGDGDGDGDATVTEGGVSATAGEARVQITLFDANGEDRDLE